MTTENIPVQASRNQKTPYSGVQYMSEDVSSPVSDVDFYVIVLKLLRGSHLEHAAGTKIPHTRDLVKHTGIFFRNVAYSKMY
jgi:hypothetical protein